MFAGAQMKALILSTHTGGGHDAAAFAVREALEARGVQCRVMDSVAFGGERLTRLVSRTYIRMAVRTPALFGRVYRIGDAVRHSPFPSPVYLVNASYAGRLADAVERYAPDMVVCTHLYAGQSMTWVRRHRGYPGLLAMVMTDYTFIPFSEEVRADLFFVGHRDMLSECGRIGVDGGRVRVTGIPVSRVCVRRAYRPSFPRRVVLAGGSIGAGNLPATVRQLRECLPPDVRLQVVAGDNEQARKEAEAAARGDGRIEVFGRVTPLSQLVCGADLLITKSGGLTTTEAMVMGTPMLIYGAIEGCETINAALLERHGLAAWARNAQELASKLLALLEDDEARMRMTRRQVEEIPGSPADLCAEELLKEAGKG